MSASTSNTTVNEKSPFPSYQDELASFETRLRLRREAEKYAPWHPRNVLLHPSRTWKLAFGTIGDEEMEKILAHMDDSGTAGSKDKPRPKPKRVVGSLKF